jgi:hypothetical protein
VLRRGSGTYPGRVAGDVILTRYERRCWRRLRRQLEGRPPGTPRAVRFGGLTAVLAVLLGGILGGPAGSVAVLGYFAFFLGIWGLNRLLWRPRPTR